MPVYFGDLHGHGEISPCYWSNCPECTPAHFFEYARRVSGLDFAALTEHDHALTEETWAMVQEEVRRQVEPGVFIPILAYEWTNNGHGHQNVYFGTDQGLLVQARQGEGWITPKELWSRLLDGHCDAITVPHHVGVTQFPADWDFYDPMFQPVSEITSLWGNFLRFERPDQTRISNILPTRFVEEVLTDGYRFGFVGGSDSHDCRPGNPHFAGRTKPNVAPGQNLGQNPLAPPNVDVLGDETCNTRGLTAIWADELTRPALFDAVRRRHTYATTGARILLDVRMGEAVMGDEVESDRADITGRVIGTTLLDSITVYCNNRPVHTVRPEDTDRVAFSYHHDVTGPHTFFYVEVRQRDGHRAWSSPIWVTAKTLKSTSPTSKDISSNDDDASPYRLAVTGPQHTKGPWVQLETRDVEPHRHRVSFRIESKGWEQAISGEIVVDGVHQWRVRDVGLMTAKYGGDFLVLTETGLRFHFPLVDQRQEMPGLELLLDDSVENRPSQITLSFRGIQGVIDHHNQHAGDFIVLTGENPETLAHVRMREDALLVWPDRGRW